tara:strand:- start:464 stop:742 length:279 start_codon:yes stop_codon:yes gene_type:complete
MGLTTRELQSKLSLSDCPHYYEMTLPNGSKRHCGTMKDVECILSMYPNAVYAKILLPHPPQTVDVSSITLDPDPELKPQHSLPESELIELEL